MSCADAEPVVVLDCFKQSADQDFPFEIDLFEFCAVMWAPNREYASGQRAHPTAPAGFALEALTDGVSGQELPPFREVANATFREGSMQWKVIPASVAGFNPASDPTYSIDPDDESGALDVLELDILNGRLLSGVYTGGQRGGVYEVSYAVIIDGLQRGLRQTVRVS